MIYKEGSIVPIEEVNKETVSKFRKGLLDLLENQERIVLKRTRDNFEKLENYYDQELSKRGLDGTDNENYTLWTMIDGVRGTIDSELGQPVSEEYLQQMLEKVDNLFKDQE